MSLVVVSNRVAKPKPNEPMTGGLAAALLPVVENSGAIWVGSSGRVRDSAHKDSFANIESLGKGAIAMVDLPEAHYAGYYEGFANSALWPALHSRSDLIRSSQSDYQSYREINAFMARALLRFRKPDTSYWIHDYHFLTLARELRALGVDQPIGFFLHTPWPSARIFVGVPHHRELVEAMLSYDVIGFQTDHDCAHFTEYLQTELGLRVEDGLVRTAKAGIYAGRARRTRLQVFPIGIAVEGFAAQAARAASHPEVARLRMSLEGKQLAIGVDRVDYSKGLVNRIGAFDRLLTMHPSLSRKVSMLQIATPSRETIEAYGQLQAELTRLVTTVNGRHGEVDWTPIRFISKGYSQQVLSGFYRVAAVGVVTPLHDGMNLVAKEYVAAQNPDNPGVLVLSKFAGAANELDAALLVNPHDIDGMAQAIATALAMPLDERRERWDAMMAKLREHTVQSWFSDFVAALDESAAASDGLLRHTSERPPFALTPALRTIGHY